MEIKMTTLEGKAAGSVTLSDAIFGLEPRKDLIHRCINWQLAKRRAGTHKVKNRAEIWRTGKKLSNQKGGGNARHGSHRVNLFRGGGRSFGPVVRSHAHDLPKKVRALALRHALSANALIIDGVQVEAAFANAARNIPNIDVLPVQGINVYDILRRQKLVLTKAALDALEARFK
jgi:large subunit ribosomal protein L4